MASVLHTHTYTHPHTHHWPSFYSCTAPPPSPPHAKPFYWKPLSTVFNTKITSNYLSFEGDERLWKRWSCLVCGTEELGSVITKSLLNVPWIGLNPDQYFWMGHSQPLFRLPLVFWNKQSNFYRKSMCTNVMSIQYTVPSFKPTTSRTWVASLNH